MSSYKTPNNKVAKMAQKAMYAPAKTLGRTAQEQEPIPTKAPTPTARRGRPSSMIVWGSPDGETQEFLKACVRVAGEVDESVVSIVPVEQQAAPDGTMNYALLIEALDRARKATAPKAKTVIALQRVASPGDVQALATKWVVKPSETILVRVWVPDVRSDADWANRILDTENHARFLGYKVVSIVGADIESTAAWLLLHAGIV